MTDEHLVNFCAGFCEANDLDSRIENRLAHALQTLLSASKPAAPMDDEALRTLALSVMGRSPKHEENIIGAMNLIRNALLAAAPAAPAREAVTLGEGVVRAADVMKIFEMMCISRVMTPNTRDGWLSALQVYAVPDVPQPSQPVEAGETLANSVTVDRGALQAAINMLRRDAAEGRPARGELADELAGRRPGQSAVVLDDDRAAFEAWAARYTYFPENYDNIPAWLAWQARAASPQTKDKP